MLLRIAEDYWNFCYGPVWRWIDRVVCALISIQKITTRHYDNACNISKSIILRVPWLNDMMRVDCDRFHYASHTCRSVADPSSYPCDNHRTSNSEAVNHLWSATASFRRYLKPENLMTSCSHVLCFWIYALDIVNNIELRTWKTQIWFLFPGP